MAVVTIEGRHQVAFGLSWRVIDQLVSRNGVIKELKRDGAKLQASFRTDRHLENIGALKASAQKGKTLSAAGQVATHPHIRGATALVVLEEEGTQIASGLVGIIGMQDGNVILDALVSTAEAPAVIVSYTDLLARNGRSFLLFGTIHTSNIAAAAARAEGAMRPFTWADLLPARRGKPWQRSAAVYLAPLKTDRGLKLAAIGAVSVAALGAGLYVADWLEEKAEADRLFTERQKQDPKYLYQQSIKQFMATPRVLLADAMPAIREAVGPLDVQRKGWKLKTIVCGQAGCSATWTRAFGTFDDFMSDAPAEWLPVVPSEDLGTLTHQFPISLPKRVLPDRTRWPTQAAFLQTEASRWQRMKKLNLAISLGKPELRALPNGGGGSPATQAAYAAVPDAIRGANWTIAKANWLLSEAFELAPETMALESLTLTFTGKDVVFDANGVSYVTK